MMVSFTAGDLPYIQLF